MTGRGSMKGTILIADDEPLARRTLREHLRDLGCSGEIHEAPDGKTAIALANKVRPELMFSQRTSSQRLIVSDQNGSFHRTSPCHLRRFPTSRNAKARFKAAHAAMDAQLG